VGHSWKAGLAMWDEPNVKVKVPKFLMLILDTIKGVA